MTVLDDRVLEVLTRLEAEDMHERAAGVAPEQRSLACGPDAGRLLFALVSAAQDARVLEIGASRGYSTIWLAAAARLGGGSVVSLEQDRAKVAAWHLNLRDAGLDDNAVLVEGDALGTLSRLEERFSIAFLDAWKPDYELYFTAVRSLVEPGAVVVADNVTSHESLAPYSARRQADPTLASLTVPVGSGLEVSVVLAP